MTTIGKRSEVGFSTGPTAVPRYSELLIDGKWQPSRSLKRFEDRDPASGEVLASVAAADTDDVDRAVQAASEAFRREGWRNADPGYRGRALLALASRMRAAREELALLEARDVGKFLSDARLEVDLAASLVEYYGGAADKVGGETYQAGQGKLAYTLREPLGPVAAIVPWNYPLPLAVLKLAPALAMGNTVVLKPAEEAPLSTMLLGQLALEAGIPPGVVNVLPGSGEVAGAHLVRHPEIAMIAFTGSTEVGKEILHVAADRIARVELELGGKSPQIIFSDADLDAATVGVGVGLFKNAGQDCCAGSRILIHADVYDEMVDRLLVLARSQRLGDPFVRGTTMGPLISVRQRERVQSYVESARQAGASPLVGGTLACDVEARDVRRFFEPTFLAHVTPDMKIFQEEVFGPIGTLTVFTTESEAVEIANQSKYGLAAAVWTKDLATALRVTAQIQAGMVWVNEYYAHVMAMPFGGYKQSGLGKDYSLHALDSYSQLKEVAIRFAKDAA
jgi:acyl-CoA reductase-like NAD-dependent aldehyde dehydrogenase